MSEDSCSSGLHNNVQIQSAIYTIDPADQAQAQAHQAQQTMRMPATHTQAAMNMHMPGRSQEGQVCLRQGSWKVDGTGRDLDLCLSRLTVQLLLVFCSQELQKNALSPIV